MKGSIRQLTPKSFQLQVYTGTKQDGKPRRHFETVRGKKSDAQRRLNELLVSMDKGIFTPPGRMTVGQLFEAWLEGYVKSNCSHKTQSGYRNIINNHLIPAFGGLLLKQLTPTVIQKYYGKAVAGLSARTVAKHHRLLSHALKSAIRQGYLGNNPCQLVDAPSWKGKTMRTLIPSEVEQLMIKAKGNYYYPLIYTAVSSGLRQAELLGLRWRDIDLDMLSISVCQVYYKNAGLSMFKEPKTKHSRRRVAMTQKLALFLRAYKVERISIYHTLGKTLAPDDLVFASVEGKPLDPSVLSHNFSRLARQAGLGSVRFHDLRHTFASLMLLRGASPKVISECLGHASVAFTMDVYSHIIEGMQEEAMALLDGVLPEGNFESFNANLTQTLDIMSTDNRVLASWQGSSVGRAEDS